MQTIEKLLSQNPVFAALPEASRSALSGEALKRHYRKGEFLAMAGDQWPYLFIVAEGEVIARKSSLEGRSLVVTAFEKGDIFWGLAFFFNGMPMPVSLETSKAATVYLWTITQLQPYLVQHGVFSWELSRLMVQKMARASQILEEIAFQPVAGRLAKLLSETAGSGSQSSVTRSLTLDEMAARIGSTREMVCRFLHRFADDGIIDITRTEFRVTDPDRLAEMAKNSKG